MACLSACTSGGSPTSQPSVASTPPSVPSATAQATTTTAPTSDASQQPSPSVTTIVEPSGSTEPALKLLWEGKGRPAPSQPCTYSPTVDSQGRLWVNVCWDNRFWIFKPDGTFVEAWGTPGSGPGQFDFAYSADHDSIGGLAFAPDGSFYTFEAGNLRVQHFGKDRKFISSWGSFGTDPGQFAKPTAIAVDQRGQVYVADGARADVQVFAGDGTYVRTVGAGKVGQPSNFAYLDVDRDGNVYVSEENHIVAKYGPDGTPLVRYDLTAIPGDASDISIGPSGQLFVSFTSDTGAHRAATVALDPQGKMLHLWPGVGEDLLVDKAGTGLYATDVEAPYLAKYALPSK
jgi:sugar lactone lactonase YvrE